MDYLRFNVLFSSISVISGRCLDANERLSLVTGLSVFSGTGIACFPDSRPCGVCGAAFCLRPCKPTLRSFRARASHASPTAGPAVFAGSQLDCVPDNRPFRLFRGAHRMLPWQQALRSLRSSTSCIHTFGQLKCVTAAKMHSICKLAFGLQTRNRQRIGVWASNWRLGCNWGSGCKMAFEFVREQATRTFRRRTTYAPLTTGSAEFAGPQSLCVPANRPYGLFGHGHRLLNRQHPLRCLRGRKSFASLQTGPSVFSGTGIACFPDSRPCSVCGYASRLRLCKPALRSFRARASPTTGTAVFAGPQFVCVPANRPFGLFGHGHRMWRLGCNLGFWLHSDFPALHIVCSLYNRLCCVCEAAIPLRPCKPALRSFLARASHASPTAGPAVFAGTQVDCVPAIRPFGLFGHGHRMLPRQQTLWCLWGRNSFAFLLTGLWCFRARASHVSPTAGPVVFAGPQFVCVPANRLVRCSAHVCLFMLCAQSVRVYVCVSACS